MNDEEEGEMRHRTPPPSKTLFYSFTVKRMKSTRYKASHLTLDWVFTGCEAEK